MKTVFNVMLLLVVIVSATAFSSCKEKRGELKKIWYNGSYNRDFNDLNDVHLSVAKKIGIGACLFEGRSGARLPGYGGDQDE